MSRYFMTIFNFSNLTHLDPYLTGLNGFAEQFVFRGDIRLCAVLFCAESKFVDSLAHEKALKKFGLNWNSSHIIKKILFSRQRQNCCWQNSAQCEPAWSHLFRSVILRRVWLRAELACAESLISRISPRKQIFQQTHFSMFIRGPGRLVS